ncbi:NAD(P)-dependent malic enzyme [Streptococcus halichoeri]|uniref:NAD(P)-dependent malic enzyme n=1 Tax=Streptococcus halichoeri TaxID=254785 RepID=UPI001C8E054A|nr:NADP-dependent malic enzyme [Streptococcus halichoeri]
MVDFNKVLELHQHHTGVLDIKADIAITSKDDLAQAYTPGVAEIARRIEADASAKNKFTMSGKLVALITDGSAVLGLGNIGPAGGLPIVEGKALIYKNFSGVDGLPIAIEQVPVDEMVATIKNIAKSFAGIHLEDIAAPRCFELEEKLKASLAIPVYHDDQTGTAIVVLAALINAAKVVNKPLKDLKVLVHGVGASGLATAKLLYHYGIQQISLMDRYGKVETTSPDYNPYQKALAAKVTQSKGQTLDEVIEGQDVFIGLSDKEVLSQQQVAKMAKDSIVFALANPIPEILPQLAHAGGAKVVATGSSQYPNQVNNVLAFPGLFKGVLATQLKDISLELQVAVAQALSALTSKPTPEKIIIDVFDERVVPVVVKAVKAFVNH